MFKKKIFLALLSVLIFTLIFSESMIRLKVATFSTDFEPPQFKSIGLQRDEVKGDYDYFLVQFSGLVNENLKNVIKKAGGIIYDYIPDNAFIVKLSNKSFENLKSKKFIKFMQIWQPAYRIAPNLISDKQEPFKGDIPGRINLLVAIFAGENVENFHAKLKQIPDVVILAGPMPVRISVPAEKANDIAKYLANQIEVYWVERDYPVELHNAWSRWILSTFDTLNMKAATDSWKSQLTISTSADSLRLPLYAHGIYGQNQIVGVDDTGMDYDNIYFRDPLGTKPVYDKDKDRVCESTGSHRKIVAYNVHADTFDLSSSGHGSHTTGSVAADSMNSGLPGVTAYARVMGMAPLARLAFTDIGGANDALVLPTNYQDIYQWAYNAGARIHSSSWGQSAGGSSSYTLNAQQLDSCAWDKKDFLMFRSAGNSNTGTSTDSVNTPATAKNIVCVGATESGFGSGATTWAVNGTSTRNELLDVAEFSSHGPTKEGMMRPDLCGTGGWYIWSVDSDGSLTTNNAGITYMGGTSMSTPTVAGFAALVRQYFVEGWYPSGTKNSADAFTPSAALIKALMINSTRNSPGAYSISTINNTGTQNAPSQGQGWGRIVIDDALYFSGDVRDLKVWDITSGFTAAGQYNEYTLTTGPSTTEYIKIVLCWTDYPAAVGADPLVVNNLNLTVTAGGNTYLGNVFGTNARSITGGSADVENVTEVVWLDPIPNSTITIRVTAATLPNGPQPYALVATGDFVTSLPAGNINYLKNSVLDSPTPVLVDGKLNNGEITDLNIWVVNNTGSNQNTVTGKLREGSSYVTVLDSLGSYGNILNGDSATSVYRLQVANNTPNGTSIPCTLFVNYGTSVDTSTFTLTVTGVSVVQLSTSELVFDLSVKKTYSEILGLSSRKYEEIYRSGYFEKIGYLNLDDKKSDSKGTWDTLKWDDAENEGVFTLYGVSYFANKFSVSQGCSLRAIWWGRLIESGLNRTDTLYVWTDNAGNPGTLLGKYVVAAYNTGGTAQFVRATLSTPVYLNGTFWVGVFAVTNNATTPPNRRSYMLSDTLGGTYSYYASSSAGPWTNMSPNGDLVIRAEVEYPVIPAATGTFYVKNTYYGSVLPFDVTGITKAQNSAWLASISPTTGTVNLNDSLGVTVIVDTTGLGLQLGVTYYDTLVITTSADIAKAVTVRLPVRLIMPVSTTILTTSLIADVNGRDVILKWSSNDQSLKNWVIERDNITLGMVSSTSFVDKDVSYGKHSYRVGYKIGDATIFSDATTVFVNKLVTALSVYSNHKEKTVSIKFSNGEKQKVSIEIFDMLGRKVKSLYNGILSEGLYNYTVDDLNKGVWFIKVQTSTEKISERFVIFK